MGEHADHHQIPRTYLRAWSTNGHSLWQMDISKKIIERVNINNHFYTKHEYSINPGAMNLLPDEMESFFNDFHFLNVQYNGMQLNTAELLNRFYPFYDQWEIYDKEMHIISPHKKNALRNSIIEKRDISIEIQLQKYEAKWPKYRDELIRRVIESKLTWIDAYSLGYFVRFMVLLHWRGFGRSVAENKAFETIEDIVPLSEISISPENRIHKNSTNARLEVSRDFRLNYFRQFFDNEGLIYDHAIRAIPKATLLILVAPQNCRFITSDSPCNVFGLKDNQLGLPISPLFYIAFTKKLSSNDRYIIKRIAASNVDKINMITYQKADSFVMGVSETDLERLAGLID